MSGDEAFRVPTTPIAPGHDRRPRVIVALLVAVVVGGFVLARWSDRPAPAVVVLETLRPAEAVAAVPTATPLPERQWFSAPAAPLHDVWLEAGQVRRLPLAAARLDGEPVAQTGRDMLLPTPDGGSVCLCWRLTGDGAAGSRQLEVVRRDDDDQVTSRTALIEVERLDVLGQGDGRAMAALEPSPDGRTVYLAVAAREDRVWTLSLSVIDLRRDAIVDRVELLSVGPADDDATLTVDRPEVRVAPDGRRVLVVSGVRRLRLIGPDRITPQAWVVTVRGDRIGRRTRVDDLVPNGPTVCDWTAFVGPEIIAQGCRTGTAGLGGTAAIRRWDGSPGGIVSIEVPPGAEAEDALIDATNGVVYTWDPVAHVLRAVDVPGGVVRVSEPPDDLTAPEQVEILGPRPSDGAPVTWTDGRAATDARGLRRLVGSPDGRLLFAIGQGVVGDSSTGVWVFDPVTLEVVERWPALAAYASLGLLEDGRWLAAIGRPGLTGTGDPADWAASLTIHDILSGRPVLRLGDLGSDGGLTFARPVYPAAAP